MEAPKRRHRTRSSGPVIEPADGSGVVPEPHPESANQELEPHSGKHEPDFHNLVSTVLVNFGNSDSPGMNVGELRDPLWTGAHAEEHGRSVRA
jgi:hypothetical protein